MADKYVGRAIEALSAPTFSSPRPPRLRRTLHFGYQRSTNLFSDSRLVWRGLLRDGAPPASCRSLLRWTQVVICAGIGLHGLPPIPCTLGRDCLVCAVLSAPKYLCLVGTSSGSKNFLQPFVRMCVLACAQSDPVACMFPGILHNTDACGKNACLSPCLSRSYSCSTLVPLALKGAYIYILNIVSCSLLKEFET